jgi:hypothetical protein
MITWLAVVSVTNGRDEIEDIQPPISADWTIWLIGLLAFLLVLAIVAWRLYPESRKKVDPPPLPREAALRRLGELKAQLGTISLYRFAIEVSDVLRGFIEQQYGVKAVRLTTPEFLFQASKRLPFTPAQHIELNQFLRTSDNIKFARVEAGQDEGQILLQQAETFVDHEH